MSRAVRGALGSALGWTEGWTGEHKMRGRGGWREQADVRRQTMDDRESLQDSHEKEDFVRFSVLYLIPSH